MELLSLCHSEPCCSASHSSWKLVGRSLNSGGSKLPVTRKTRVGCHGSSTKWGSGAFCALENNYSKTGGSRSSDSLGAFQNVYNSDVLGKSINNYVTVGNEDAISVSEKEDSTTKVLIPGLPDESIGDSGSPISSGFWEWKPNLNVHYEKSGSENAHSPAVLFLPGFGVGSFHYEKQLKDLGREHRVWAVDFLGQGLSLPTEDPAPLTEEEGISTEKDSSWGFGEQAEPWATELVYSIDLWRDQVRYFIEEVIGEPVYIVGNSLGGYVALYFAACNPQLVKGVTLLNATPFWGFLPNPTKSPRLAKLFPWAGTFPLPAGVRRLIQFLWQKVNDPESIAEVLKQVYADHSTKVDKVFSRILEIADHPAAAASFASIMCAPKGELSFGEALSRCKMNDLPICLMYGKEDPWVKPVWGFQVKKLVPEAPYYEISPAGHCPHDEVPEVHILIFDEMLAAFVNFVCYSENGYVTICLTCHVIVVFIKCDFKSYKTNCTWTALVQSIKPQQNGFTVSKKFLNLYNIIWYSGME